jgi:hypothetical protein
MIESVLGPIWREAGSGAGRQLQWWGIHRRWIADWGRAEVKSSQLGGRQADTEIVRHACQAASLRPATSIISIMWHHFLSPSVVQTGKEGIQPTLGGVHVSGELSTSAVWSTAAEPSL